jgi:hypothetical protein
VRAWILMFATVAACGGKKKEPPADDQPIANKGDHGQKKKKDPTGKPRPQTKLDVTVDGKPVKMQVAYAVKDPGGLVRFVVSSVPLSCEDITGNGRFIYDGEVTFEATVANQLQPDGSFKPALTSWEFEGSSHQETKPTTGTGDGSVDAVSTADVDFTVKGASKDGQTLVAKGTIDAIGCTPKPASAPPRMHPASAGLTMTIAGKKFPVKNALIDPADWPSLMLTSGGETCAHEAGEEPGEIVLRFTWFKKDKPEVSQITLGGTALPNAMDQTFDKKAVTFEPAPPTAIKQTKVSVHTKVMGYPVEIEGSITPDLCKK